jgi:acyl dehydratase
MAEEQRNDLVIGAVIGPLFTTPTRKTLVRYAAASHDFAPLHFDEPYAHSRGFPTVLVHGMLKAGYLGHLVTEWAGPDAILRRFSVRYLRPDYPDNRLACFGRVLQLSPAADGTDVELELWVENLAAERTVDGKATIHIPR